MSRQSKYNLYGALACLRKWGFDTLVDAQGKSKSTMLWWQNPPSEIDRNSKEFNPTKGGGVFSSTLNRLVLTAPNHGAKEMSND